MGLLAEDCLRQRIEPRIGDVFHTKGSSPIFGSNNLYHPPAAKHDDWQEGEVAVTFKQLPLWSGGYMISVWLSDGWSPIKHRVPLPTPYNFQHP